MHEFIYDLMRHFERNDRPVQTGSIGLATIRVPKGVWLDGEQQQFVGRPLVQCTDEVTGSTFSVRYEEIALTDGHDVIQAKAEALRRKFGAEVA